MKIEFRHSLVSESEIKNLREQLFLALDKLLSLSEKGDIGFLSLCERDISKTVRLAESKRKKLKQFLLIGIGGSSLGAECLIQAVRGSHENFFVADNADPEKLTRILSEIEPERCCFNIVSKSGSTAETIANFMALLGALSGKISWKKLKENMVITTDPERGSLRELAAREEMETLEVPPNVPGRYSVLSDVGLFPAAFMGVDIARVLEGAKKAKKLCEKRDVFENPALLLSAIYWAAYLKGKNIVVMMPYLERLSKFADWFRQLWAESLGKNGRGQTPVKALGTVDQHSQIQLYNDGPKDKIVTLISVKKTEADLPLPKVFPDLPSFGYLGGHSLGDLFRAELLGTMGAFVKYGVPFVHIEFEKLSEEEMGELFIVFEVATAVFGFLLGVNPFDQPAVEEGKRFAYGLLGREGFVDKKEELKRLLSF